MAIQLQRGERDLQRIVDSIIQLNEGRGLNVGDVTLRASQTTTTVNFPNCSKDCRIFLFPQTANAAAALATTYVLKTNILQRSFIITHASNIQTDKNFSFLCIGG
jgi:hypothetical protein